MDLGLTTLFQYAVVLPPYLFLGFQPVLDAALPMSLVLVEGALVDVSIRTGQGPVT